MGRLRGLVAASHPLPSVAVTGFAAAFGAAAGLPAGRVALLAAAILTGQLSVGWCNDATDAARDLATGRAEKPIAAGAVPAGTVRAAMWLAALACVPLSLALGVVPGLIHLAAVASAWSYNLWLKSSPASPLPFFLSFGLLPAIVATALPGTPAPRPAVLVAGGLLGVAAHFANTVKDTDADARSGVRGLPQRLGPRRSVLVSAGLVLVVALLLIGLVPAGPATAALLGLGAALALSCVLAPRAGPRARTPLVFRLNMAAAGCVLAGFLASGGALTLGRS